MNLTAFPGLLQLREDYIQSEIVYKKAMNFFITGMCTLISQEGNRFYFNVEDRFDDFRVEVDLTGFDIKHTCGCNSAGRYCSHASAALVFLADKFEEETGEDTRDSEIYSQEEMIRRVMKERQERAAKEDFTVEPGENIYGFHDIKTARGKTYSITIRDFDTSSGYCSCPDFKTNKLGTCKHLIFAVNHIKSKYNVKQMVKQQPYPFVEIFCDPLNDYHITYYHKGRLDPAVDKILKKYFQEDDYILPPRYHQFIRFPEETGEYKKILVRPEVEEKIEAYFEHQEMKKLSQHLKPDFTSIDATLFPYQKEGIHFSLFKKGNIIADEMGLGKTIQAITTAVLKGDIYNFKRVLVICPASLKYQWKKEIEKFTRHKAVIVEGTRPKRHDIYRESKTYFLVANYEAVLRDITIIKKFPPDMVILDEAQRIKNYDTQTSHAVKSIPRKHSLVITGTPIENKLIDLYSIMNFIDPHYLAPLWEFSMNHCLFDKSKKNKINGYYNLQALKKRLGDKIIRREKMEVLEQLPEVQEMTVPIQLSQEQQEIHSGYARSLMPLLNKKYKTIYDMQRIFQLLTAMRMVCNSTYLIDKETHISPKLDELKEILLEKLNIKKGNRKVIIFSEWITMLKLIEKILQSNGIGYVMLTGSIPVKDRGRLIDEFTNNPDCLVFLSTEAGGSGLNLQAADTVINFELPWNPAKKNQRIGRIHRIGQKSSSLTVINLMAVDSIEERIAGGIQLKESLFDAVLNEGDMTDEVDFTKKGRSTVIDQIQKIVTPFTAEELEEETEEGPSPTPPAREMQPSLFDEETEEDSGIDQLAEETREKSIQETQAPRDMPEKTAKSKEPGQETRLSPPSRPTTETSRTLPTPETIESTLNQGMQFLNGVFSMATGQQLVTEEQAITVNRETGEVVMKFKLPGFPSS
jgi:ERCC4-related helicase/predicted nucleic acid-binding Zn finger protein